MQVVGSHLYDTCATPPFKWVVLPGLAITTATYLFCKHILPSKHCPHSLRVLIVEVLPTPLLPAAIERIPLAEWALFNTKYTLFWRLITDFEDSEELKIRFRAYLARKFEDKTLPLHDEALRLLIIARLRGEDSSEHANLESTLQTIEERMDQVLREANMRF